MTRFLALGAGALAILGSLLLLRIVLHLYTDHGRLDLFHLLVGIGAGLLGSSIVWHSYRRRAA